MNNAIESKWRSEIEQKTSLKYINSAVLKVGKCHPIWSTVRNSVSDSRRVQLKCKLLTGTYILQSGRAVFNQHQVDPTCKRCTGILDTRQHFIAECSVYERGRNVFKERLYNNTIHIDLQDPETFTRLVMDVSAVVDEASDQSVNNMLDSIYTRFTKRESPSYSKFQPAKKFYNSSIYTPHTRLILM